MKEILDTYGTRILGYILATLGAIGTLATTGAFEGLLEPATVRWLGIVATLSTTVFGMGTVARGSSNAAGIRVADAMETAINATPPGETHGKNLR